MNDTENDLPENEKRENEAEVIEFALDPAKLSPLSSAEIAGHAPAIDDEDILSLAELPTKIQNEPELTGKINAEEEVEDPVFKELSAPKLPEISKENRARLQMQSPTRLHFYWSVKNNPFQTLNRTFGGKTGSYTLIVKLINQKNGREDLSPIEAEGSWWFDVDADSAYCAEIGFYAPNRPFIRIMFSNMVETPRLSPSPRRDYSADFEVSANQFAKVLDVSGFQQDAFEVALAGDDVKSAETDTNKAFSQFIGQENEDFSSDEIRLVLLALASGNSLESLRGQIGTSLYTFLQKNIEKLNPENALAALQENFGIFADEFEEEFTSSAVFGASLINFPQTSKRKRFLPKFAPLSSFGKQR